MRVNKNKVLLRMAKLGFNQAQLAERSKVSRQTISYVINGKECCPEVFGKIATALEVEPEEIIE